MRFLADENLDFAVVRSLRAALTARVDPQKILPDASLTAIIWVWRAPHPPATRARPRRPIESTLRQHEMWRPRSGAE